MVANEGVDRFVALTTEAPGCNLLAAIGIEGGLREDLARQADRGAHLLPNPRDGSYS